jgi:hypothetical protein
LPGEISYFDTACEIKLLVLDESLVPGPDPAIIHRLRGRERIIQIANHGRWSAYLKLSLGAFTGHIHAVLISDPGNVVSV